MVNRKYGLSMLAVALMFSPDSVSAAAPTAAQMLQFSPKQSSINMSTPAESEISACKVELVRGNKLSNGKVASGWVLKDGQNRLLRRFYDSNGDNQIDIWSYYLNGDECYREVDSNLNGKVDQYRWLGANGSKWGIDSNEDGRIDTWKVISPEETSQEILAAIMTRDFPRLQALMVTKSDLDAMELPDSEVNRIKSRLAEAGNKFQSTTAALLKLNDKVKWIHLESAAPECTPLDSLGSKVDLIRMKQATILYSDGEKVNDFIQTGELILVGRAWKIIEAPLPGAAIPGQQANANTSGVAIPDNAKEEIEQLKLVDDKYKSARTPPEVIEYNLARAGVLEKIIAKINGRDRDEWIKQVADSYSTAAQNGDKGALAKLEGWKAAAAKEAPGSNLAAYVSYRTLSADYALKLGEVKNGQMPAFQEAYKDKLTKFVQEFTTADDTPDALMQLGMLNEFLGKETEAKNWYGSLVKNFEKNPIAGKAAGAIRRLNLDGQEFELSSLTLGSKNPFDIKSNRGKVTIVYYWASWNNQSVSDFAKIKSVLATFASKGVELVCVNLDNSEGDAIKFLQNTPVPGMHLYQQGGLESPPAVQYGIMVLPNMIIVGQDGKVANRAAQVNALEDELKKVLK